VLDGKRQVGKLKVQDRRKVGSGSEEAATVKIVESWKVHQVHGHSLLPDGYTLTSTLAVKIRVV